LCSLFKTGPPHLQLGGQQPRRCPGSFCVRSGWVKALPSAATISWIVLRLGERLQLIARRFWFCRQQGGGGSHSSSKSLVLDHGVIVGGSTHRTVIYMEVLQHLYVAGLAFVIIYLHCIGFYHVTALLQINMSQGQPCSREEGCPLRQLVLRQSSRWWGLHGARGLALSESAGEPLC
jgi:hypothetical protein